MIVKFDRIQISSVNDISAGGAGKVKGGMKSRTVEVPEKETFRYIFEKAKKGNEMAAVLLDDWQKNCKPKGDEEKQIINMINMAANSIFK